MHRIRLTVISLMLVGLGTPLIFAHEASETSADTAQKPNIAMLLSDQLERVEGTEVIVSKVQIPPNMTLPKHWHPGEEFVYVIKGSVTLWQEGKDDVVFAAGDAGKVPLKQVHTAITGDEGVELIVFRVHETGQPERVLVGDSEKD